ncbi:hypothetical protein MNV49_005780 [Pseudohyphozyma bogoriensis]|nr:hypothetical protein MNV49_005780 [Pseudohyphozyma bogoriensis]
MEHERAHRNGPGDLEVGYADVLAKTMERKPAQHAPLPEWLVNWEDRRPRLLTEMFAECLGVYIYCLCGVGASAAFFVTSAEKLSGFGSLLTIGLAYGIGILMAIIIAGPASGGHLSPCYTIAFALFKGFPARKVPFYILAQTIGGFLGILSVYGMYHQAFVTITEEMLASPTTAAAIYTAQGPAGVLALFAGVGQELKWVFLNEFICNVILSILVFSVLDPSNVFISFSSAPVVIGIAYTALICAFAPDSLALNTARDLGGRIACAAAGYGSQCFPRDYTALACLTNILATQVGALIQICLISDSARPIHNMPPDETRPSLRVISRGDGTSMRVLTRDEKFNGQNQHL